MSSQADIEQAIAKATGSHAPIVASEAVSGGCINHSRIVSLGDGRRYFLKSRDQTVSSEMFRVESRCLQLLGAPQVIQVPRPLACGDDFLVLEVFEPGLPAPDWQEQMGRALALLHQGTQQASFGFPCDTWLGTTLQVNTWQQDWLEFWREQRLGWQLGRLAEIFDADDPLLTLGYALLERLDTLLAYSPGPAVLLHGDLWSGNADADANGSPLIFDPACYYGEREAEFGMMRLFGGFGPRCEAAYAEVWPFADGADRRIALYRLYHEMNHVLLFGAGYYQHCIRTLKSLL